MKDIEIEKKLRNLIDRMKWIRETKSLLSKEELGMSVPLVDDLTQVGNIYDLFMTYQNGKKFRQVRKQFIFVILFLCSPCSLGGAKMRRGLREKIARVLGCTSSNVSHDYKNVSFYYYTYTGFRNEVNMVLERLISDLKLKKEED